MPKKKLNYKEYIIKGVVFAILMALVNAYMKDMPLKDELYLAPLTAIAFGGMLLIVDLGWIWIDKLRGKNN